jgi:hypothetical protein
MTSRILGALGTAMAVVALAPVPLGGQTSSKRPDVAKAVPRTPDGRPDLQGYWTNATFIPLERPAEFAGKAEMTEAEAIAYQKRRELQENSQAKDDIHYDNVLWQTESYAKGMPDRRTSLIFDPVDGKIPPLTPAAQKLAAARAEAARSRGPADAAEYRSLGERCISWGNEGPPMLGATYYNNLQIFQTGGTVAVRHELMHGVRMIPLDGSPHPGPNLRLLHGDSRGRWEGDTLVVDTTNFTDRTPFRGPPATTRGDIFSGENLHVIERFTRADADTIRYRFTVEDAATWVRSWSAEMVLRKWEGPIFEYACHEGNYGLGFILSVARAQERGQ